MPYAPEAPLTIVGLQWLSMFIRIVASALSVIPASSIHVSQSETGAIGAGAGAGVATGVGTTTGAATAGVGGAGLTSLGLGGSALISIASTLLSLWVGGTLADKLRLTMTKAMTKVIIRMVCNQVVAEEAVTSPA